MKLLDIIIIFMLLFVILTGILLLYLNMPGSSLSYQPFLSSLNITSFSTDLQFYPNMRYPEKIISYQIEDVCNNDKSNDVTNAFSIIANNTILKFYKVEDNPRISVYCSQRLSDVDSVDENSKHYIAGEGGPVEIINSSMFSIILHGKIALFKSERCDKPQITIHEIFHALGFDHINNTKSIMYPLTECDQYIDSKIIDEINRLYSIESGPDLTIDKVDGNRSSKYLNFEIVVNNIGIIDSPHTILMVQSGNEAIKNFSLGNISVGSKKFLTVQNLKLPKGSNNIIFKVESNLKEINLENNIVELKIVEG